MKAAYHSTFDAYHKWLGIPPHEQPPTLYRLLGISPFEADPDVIERAAEGRLVLLKTIQHGPELATAQRLMNEVVAARNNLLSPPEKQRYDQSLAAMLAPPPQAAYEPPAAIMMRQPQEMLVQRPHYARRRVSYRRRPAFDFGPWLGILGGILGLAIGYYIAYRVNGFDPLQLAPAKQVAPSKPVK